MRKFIVVALVLVVALTAFAQTKQKVSMISKSYTQLWKDVEELQNKDLPKSTITLIDSILSRAFTDKNTPQIIKSLMFKTYNMSVIDSNNSNILFSDLEKLLADSPKAEDKAIIHSMLAEYYLKQYRADSWNINKRTNLGDFVLEDIQEWSKNIYFDKATTHLQQSVKDENALLKISAEAYKDIMTLGSDSRRTYPTLYDFLMLRAIDISNQIPVSNFQQTLKDNNLQVKYLAIDGEKFAKLNFTDNDDLQTLKYYAQLLKSEQSRNLDEAAMFTQLSLNSYLSGKSNSYKSDYSLKTLLNLEEKYRSHDFCVEVIYKITNDLSGGNNYRRNPKELNDDENTKEIYDWCKKGIDRYPKYARVNILKEKLQQIEIPFAKLDGQQVFHPDNKEKKFTISYRNLNKAILKIRDKETKAIVLEMPVDLPLTETYTVNSKEIIVTLNKTGNYEASISFDKKSTEKFRTVDFSISTLASFARKASDDNYEFYVVDRKTGAPIANATIGIYKSKWDKELKYTLHSSLKTDKQGLATGNIKIDEKSYSARYTYKVSIDKDSPDTQTSLPYNYEYNPTNETADIERINIFTDRSIYRPGQTIYFKAIAIKESASRVQTVIPNKKYTASLYDVNNQLVSEKSLKTNDFGSINGEFILPLGKLTGNYRIEIAEYSQYVSVEEYKRPTFEVTFDKLEGTFTFGDRVTIKGFTKNFSGISLQNAKVSYNINKNPLMRWYYYPSPSSNFVENGEVTTSDDGSFEINFTIPINDEQSNRFLPLNRAYNFQINAQVTDLNGETQSGDFNFSAGNVSMLLQANISPMLDKAAKDSIKISTTNLNGVPVAAKGTYTIYSLLENDSINKAIQSGEFATPSNLDLMTVLRTIPSAKYSLKLQSKDDKDRDVEQSFNFVVYSLDDKKPPIKTNNWIIAKSDKFSATQNGEIIFGVTAKDATILYDLMKGDKVYERLQFKISDTNKKLTIPYKTEYKDNITAVFTYVIDEQTYQEQVDIKKVEEWQNLTLKLDVFRDRLRPGQQEEWQISVKDNNGKPALAEVLASMYDASLDRLQQPMAWGISAPYINYSNPMTFDKSNLFDGFNQSFSFPYTSIKYPQLKWDELNWFQLQYYSITTKRSFTGFYRYTHPWS